MLKPFRSGDHATAEVWILDEGGEALGYAEVPMRRVAPREWLLDQCPLGIERDGVGTHFAICISGFLIAYVSIGSRPAKVGDSFTFQGLRVNEVPDTTGDHIETRRRS